MSFAAFIASLNGTGSGETGGGSAIDFTGKTSVFAGDSITFGSNASDNAHRWTSLFCTNKSCTESNLGISGEVLENGTVCGRTVFDETTIPTYSSGTHAALFIALGVNDIGLNNGTMTATGFETTLTSAVNYAHNTKGWPYANIVLVDQYYVKAAGYAIYVGSCSVVTQADTTRVNAYRSAVANVANSLHTVLAQIGAAMDGNDSLISGDSLHPNDTGHAFIATFMESVTYLPQ